MKTLRLFAITGGLVVFLVIGLCAILFHELGRSDGLTVWDSDGPPDASTREWLSQSGYPSSITRVVKKGEGEGFHGDYTLLTILCFPLADLEEMKRAIGGSEGWDSGFPTGPNWRNLIEGRAPVDLAIDRNASPGSFIHVHITPADGAVNTNWKIIDITRGISYKIILQM